MMENEILEKLREPFPPHFVKWKPGSVTEDGERALALAYADLRAYQERLDEVCGMEWSVSYTPWGDRIVCHLTIGGVTRSSTGEPDMQAERSEIAGTSAEAQAFKRACSMFGLGRYLYHLPMMWVDYDAERRRFTDTAKGRLASILNEHMRRNGSPVLAQIPDAGADDDKSELLSKFHELGENLYGEQWERVSVYNAQRISSGAVGDPDELGAGHLRKLVAGLKKIQAERAAA